MCRTRVHGATPQKAPQTKQCPDLLGRGIARSPSYVDELPAWDELSALLRTLLARPG